VLLCLKTETELTLDMLCFCKKLDNKVQKNKILFLTLVILCSIFSLHMTISQCRPWFGSAWSSSESSDLVLHTQI